MEELLKIAKEKYIIGTKFIASNTSQECVITSGLFYFDDIENCINEVDSDGKLIGTNGRFHCILSNDIWAQIISTPEIEEKDFFETATSSICKMLQTKNKAYGESALKPLNIFAKHHNYGSRLDEKLARIKNSEELKKNDVADIIGGLLLICKDKNWSDFTDLID